MAKVGLETSPSGTPAPRQIPRASWVFPAPSSPASATTSPVAEVAPDALAQAAGLARRPAGARDAHGGRLAHLPHAAQTAPMASARSPATIPRSPWRLAAMSPARP